MNPTIEGTAIAELGGSGWDEFVARASSAIEDAGIRGAIVRIGSDQCDPDYPIDPARVGRLLRRIETDGKPFAAVIEGPVTMAWFEVSLACHRRIAVDDPAVTIAICDPRSEAMPGLGGTQRLPRMVGVPRALSLLFQAQPLSAREAREAGLLDALVSADACLESGRAWILAQNAKAPTQPWDSPGFRMAGAAASSFGPAIARLREGTLGLYPAPLAILSSVYEGCPVDLDNALKIEARHSAHVRATAESRNLARLRRFRQELDGLAARPAGVPLSEFSKIGILGAGMMGSGIAYACADAGLDVVLLDVTEEKTERGKAAWLETRCLPKNVTAPPSGSRPPPILPACAAATW